MSPIFDPAVFETLKADLGDEDTLEALQMFLADAADKLAQLATRSEDRARVKLEAHSIKSSAGTFGFAELSRLARELEPKAATLEPAQLGLRLDELRRVFEASQEFARAKLLAAPPQA
jgi:HPt (histidine-containing phosphotransfer) domain-containing protein